MERIELGDLLLIAEMHCGVPAAHLAHIDRVLNLAQSALAAPFAGFGDVEVFPTFEAKAGIYCSRIATYHPFPDGNKRSAYDTMIEFIERNGRTFEHQNGDLMVTAKMVEDIAASSITEEDFLAWIAERIS